MQQFLYLTFLYHLIKLQTFFSYEIISFIYYSMGNFGLLINLLISTFDSENLMFYDSKCPVNIVFQNLGIR